MGYISYSTVQLNIECAQRTKVQKFLMHILVTLTQRKEIHAFIWLR